MSVGVLHDETQHSFRRLYRDVEVHHGPEVMKVDVALPDREVVQ
jgi:hypothetical protein